MLRCRGAGLTVAPRLSRPPAPARPPRSTARSATNQRANGTNIVLFVREKRTNALGTSPYVFLGSADYVSHEGDRPMAITWRLHRPMPTEIFLASRAAVA